MSRRWSGARPDIAEGRRPTQASRRRARSGTARAAYDAARTPRRGARREREARCRLCRGKSDARVSKYLTAAWRLDRGLGEGERRRCSPRTGRCSRGSTSPSRSPASPTQTAANSSAARRSRTPGPHHNRCPRPTAVDSPASPSAQSAVATMHRPARDSKPVHDEQAPQQEDDRERVAADALLRRDSGGLSPALLRRARDLRRAARQPSRRRSRNMSPKSASAVA